MADDSISDVGERGSRPLTASLHRWQSHYCTLGIFVEGVLGVFRILAPKMPLHEAERT